MKLVERFQCISSDPRIPAHRKKAILLIERSSNGVLAEENMLRRTAGVTCIRLGCFVCSEEIKACECFSLVPRAVIVDELEAVELADLTMGVSKDADQGTLSKSVQVLPATTDMR